MQDLRGEAARAFYEVAAEVVDVAFGVAEADELFEAYGLSADTVCLFKKVSGVGARACSLFTAVTVAAPRGHRAGGVCVRPRGCEQAP